MVVWFYGTCKWYEMDVIKIKMEMNIKIGKIKYFTVIKVDYNGVNMMGKLRKKLNFLWEKIGL